MLYSHIKDNVNSRHLKQKRRLANLQAVKTELKKEIDMLFNIHHKAVELTQSEMNRYPLPTRGRGLEVAIFQSNMAKLLMENFGSQAKFDKHKRLMLVVKGYIILFKKLDRNGFPMNTKTQRVHAILNQKNTLSLFGNNTDLDDPILYLGYQKNKFGVYQNPQIVYIDDAKIVFIIMPEEKADGLFAVNGTTSEVLESVSVRTKKSNIKKIS